MSGHIVTITRNLPGRAFASAVPIELPSTTRRSELRGFRALEVSGAKLRFSAADIEVVESMASLGLAVLLGKPDGFLADYRAAVRPPTRHEWTEDERDYLKKLKQSREHSPDEYEDVKKALRAQSKSSRESRLRECRRHAKGWIKLVRLYVHNKWWLDPLPENIRSKLCRDMAQGIALASSNDVPSLDQAHERLRAKNKRERTAVARRLKKQFGHRRARPMIPVKPNGEIDFRAVERREVLWLSKTADSGVSLIAVDQWTTTEDLRFAKRLTEERQNFWNHKKDRSI
jgi:hypothetical protein